MPCDKAGEIHIDSKKKVNTLIQAVFWLENRKYDFN